MARRVSPGPASQVDNAFAGRNSRPDLRQVFLSNAAVVGPALVLECDPVVPVTDHSLGLVHPGIMLPERDRATDLGGLDGPVELMGMTDRSGPSVMSSAGPTSPRSVRGADDLSGAELRFGVFGRTRGGRCRAVRRPRELRRPQRHTSVAMASGPGRGDLYGRLSPVDAGEVPRR
jgi:hypothetical protein